MIKILFIENNRPVVRGFRKLLGKGAATCRVAVTVDQANELIESHLYDCVILSADLFDDGGAAALKTLRSNGRKEVVMATAKYPKKYTSEVSSVSFDDYLYRPYDAHELYVRMKIQLKKKIFGEEEHPTQFGELIIDPENRLVYMADVLMPLTRKETLLLFFLLVNRNRVVSTKAIYDQLLIKDTQDEPNYGSIYEYIKNLKKKLASFGFPDSITNIKGVGYRFEWINKSAEEAKPMNSAAVELHSPDQNRQYMR